MASQLKIEQPWAVVADDNPLIAVQACDILQDVGFKAISAADAEAALGRLTAIGPVARLLVTDIDMPGPIDGLTLARTVAARWPHITILIISGKIEPQASEMPRRAMFLRKPFSAAMLAFRVARAMPPAPPANTDGGA